MGRLLPQKPPRRYPSGFCNLLDTGRDQESFRPVPTCGCRSVPGAVPGHDVDVGTGFPRCGVDKNTACTRLLQRNAAANSRTTAAFSR